MKTKLTLLTFLAVVLGCSAIDSQTERAFGAPQKQPPSGSRATNATPVLPPLPAGVTELKFNEFFANPVGARGLVLTEKLRGLDGQRVRILGYMVRQDEATPGKFLLAPLRVQLQNHDSKFADDLPPSTVYVSVSGSRDQPVSYTPEPLLLTGTLSMGNREEADGRISIVRLTLDAPPSAATQKSLPAEKGAERAVNKTGVEKPIAP